MKKAKRITFTCDGKDCKKEKTVTENKYNMSEKHYCSTSCRTTGLKNRKTNRVADPENSITYVCDRHDCNKEKTIYKSLFTKTINHFCSRDCFKKSRRDRHIVFPYKNTKTMELKLAKRAKISKDIAKYFIKKGKKDMEDSSGLKQNDNLQRFYDRHNSRLPTESMEYEIGKGKKETPQNRATNAKVAHSETKG